MRFLKVPFRRCQALVRRRERKERRKRGLPESSCLGHTVKSCMTVISKMERYHFTSQTVWLAEKFDLPKNGLAEKPGMTTYLGHKTPTIYPN